MHLLVLLFPLVCLGTFPNYVDHSKVFGDRQPLGNQSQTGFIPISSHSDTFYWLFPSATDFKNKPTIFWLQGEIGVTSLFGVYQEFTPSWTDDFNVVFVDAPAGTGFSKTSGEFATTSEEIAAQVFHFLNMFFGRHDIGSNVILAGEDYAGHTIPVIAGLVVHESKKRDLSFKLIGTSVGNGHTHAPIQVLTKAESATIFGLIDGECIPEARQHAWAASALSVAGDSSGSLLERNSLEQTILNCSEGIDMSSVGRLVGETDLVRQVETWINNPDVQGALGLESRAVVAKNVTVFENLKPDIMRVIWHFIPPVLEANIPMLWYQGQLDWIDGVYSNEAWINALQWSGAENYRKSERETIDGGYKRSYGPLTEAMIIATGHLAIKEKPGVILDLFRSTFMIRAQGPEQTDVVLM